MFGLAFVVMFAAMFFGCETQPIHHKETRGYKKMEELNEKHEDITLETEISLRGETLLVEYRVKNGSPKPIYLFNVLWEFSSDGKYIRDRRPAYILLKDDGTLHLAKEAPPLPKNKRVELKIVPFTTRVEAGKDFSEKFELSVPLSEYNPYFSDEKDMSEELKTAGKVVLSLQFVRELEEMEVKPAPLENAFSVWHKELWLRVGRLSSTPTALPVKINRRTDYFERF